MSASGKIHTKKSNISSFCKWQHKFSKVLAVLLFDSRVAVSFMETPSNTTQQLLLSCQRAEIPQIDSGQLQLFQYTWKAIPPNLSEHQKHVLFVSLLLRNSHLPKILSLKNLQPKNNFQLNRIYLSPPPSPKNPISLLPKPPQPMLRFEFSIRSSRTPSSTLDRHGTTTLQLRPWTPSWMARC